MNKNGATARLIPLPIVQIHSPVAGEPALWRDRLLTEPAPIATIQDFVCDIFKHAKLGDLLVGSADQYGVQLALGDNHYLGWMAPTDLGLHELVTQAYHNNEALVLHVLPQAAAYFTEAVPGRCLKAPLSAAAAAADKPMSPARARELAARNGEALSNGGLSTVRLITNQRVVDALAEFFPHFTENALRSIREKQSQQFDNKDRTSFAVVAAAGTVDVELQQLAYGCFANLTDVKPTDVTGVISYQCSPKGAMFRVYTRFDSERDAKQFTAVLDCCASIATPSIKRNACMALLIGALRPAVEERCAAFYDDCMGVTGNCELKLPDFSCLRRSNGERCTVSLVRLPGGTRRPKHITQAVTPAILVPITAASAPRLAPPPALPMPVFLEGVGASPHMHMVVHAGDADDVDAQLQTQAADLLRSSRNGEDEGFCSDCNVPTDDACLGCALANCQTCAPHRLCAKCRAHTVVVTTVVERTVFMEVVTEAVLVCVGPPQLFALNLELLPHDLLPVVALLRNDPLHKFSVSALCDALPADLRAGFAPLIVDAVTTSPSQWERFVARAVDLLRASHICAKHPKERMVYCANECGGEPWVCSLCQPAARWRADRSAVLCDGCAPRFCSEHWHARLECCRLCMQRVCNTCAPKCPISAYKEPCMTQVDCNDCPYHPGGQLLCCHRGGAHWCCVPCELAGDGLFVQDEAPYNYHSCGAHALDVDDYLMLCSRHYPEVLRQCPNCDDVCCKRCEHVCRPRAVASVVVEEPTRKQVRDEEEPAVEEPSKAATVANDLPAFEPLPVLLRALDPNFDKVEPAPAAAVRRIKARVGKPMRTRAKLSTEQRFALLEQGQRVQFLEQRRIMKKLDTLLRAVAGKK